MPQDLSEQPLEAYIRLRRRILSILYGFFQDVPYGAMELRQIQESCQTTPQLLNWNMVYLEKSGYVELDRSPDCPPFVACSASISAHGIDLVEDRNRFDSRFPIPDAKEGVESGSGVRRSDK